MLTNMYCPPFQGILCNESGNVVKPATVQDRQTRVTARQTVTVLEDTLGNGQKNLFFFKPSGCLNSE
jgi:hypothetical protein